MWFNKMALQMYSAKTLDVQCKNTIRAFKYNKKKEHKSIIEKKKYIYIFFREYILNKPKVL